MEEHSVNILESVYRKLTQHIAREDITFGIEARKLTSERLLRRPAVYGILTKTMCGFTTSPRIEVQSHHLKSKIRPSQIPAGVARTFVRVSQMRNPKSLQTITCRDVCCWRS